MKTHKIMLTSDDNGETQHWNVVEDVNIINDIINNKIKITASKIKALEIMDKKVELVAGKIVDLLLYNNVDHILKDEIIEKAKEIVELIEQEK